MTPAESFLVALQLNGKRCLVVGTGDEAGRRARELARASADVVVIGVEPCAEVERLAAEGRVTIARRSFAAADLEEAWLVVLADRDAELMEQVGAACAARRILFCAVDQPGHNSFHHVAVARAGSVAIGVSTGGAAPALGKRLRDELERVLGEADVGAFADSLAELRARTDRSRRKSTQAEQAARLTLSGIEIAPDRGEGPEE